jgi:GTP pyrophosphokinase
VQYGLCCHPLPGDPIFGYLGHGEGLVIHHEQCNHAQKLRHKDSERFIDVEWSDEPVRLFEAPLMVTVTNGPGVLAKVATAISQEEADITQVNMNTEISSADAIDLRFMVAVRDKHHLESVLKSLARTSCVIQAQRVMSTKSATPE